MEAVEHRVVVDVDTDLRHPPLPRPLPRNRRHHRICQQDIDRGAGVPVGLFEGGELGVDRRPQLGVTFRIEGEVGVVHPGRLVDPPSHRHRRLLTCPVRTHPHHRRGVWRAAGSDARTPRPARCGRTPTTRPATRRDVPDPHHPTPSTRSQRRRHGWPTHHRQPARSRSRASPRTPQNDPTPLSSPASNDAHTPSTPQPLIRSDPRRPTPGSGGRSPHRPHQPNPAPAAPTSPPHPNQPGHTRPHRPPTTRRSPHRHHDHPSPNPSRPTRSTRGKPDTNHPKQGVSQRL